MKQTMRIFYSGMRQIMKDGILLVLLPAPFLMGAFFKFALPWAGQWTEALWGYSISPWYGLADGLLVCMTPMFMAMISSFLLLEERDEGIGEYYQVTPAAGYPYLAARIALPMAVSFLLSILALTIFSMTGPSPGALIAASAISAVSGGSLSMLLVSLAGNRVEGLALSKLMGISLAGLAAAWLVPEPYQYAACVFPTWWIGRILRDGGSIFYLAGGLAVSIGDVFLLKGTRPQMGVGCPTYTKSE